MEWFKTVAVQLAVQIVWNALWILAKDMPALDIQATSATLTIVGVAIEHGATPMEIKWNVLWSSM